MLRVIRMIGVEWVIGWVGMLLLAARMVMPVMVMGMLSVMVLMAVMPFAVMHIIGG